MTNEQIQSIAEKYSCNWQETLSPHVVGLLIKDMESALTEATSPLQEDLDKLNDPIAVYHNIIAGKIKVPEWFKDSRPLQQRIEQFESAIKDVLSQQGDDLCWLDIYTKLAGLVGMKFEPTLLPKEVMLRNCERFVDSLKTGKHYQTQTDLEGQVEVLREALEAHRDAITSIVSKNNGIEPIEKCIKAENLYIKALSTTQPSQQTDRNDIPSST